MPLIEPLCNFCTRVPLDPKKLSPTATFTLGSSLWIKDSCCPFCRLLNLVYYEDYRTGSRNSRYKEQIILCWAPASGPGKRGAFYVADCAEQWICFAAKSDTNTFVNDAYFLRPLLHCDLDISRIARWISTCETIHSDNCVLKAPKVFRDAFTGLNVMRLIDVYQNCLVEVQDLRQYVALSYIWGAVPNFRLTTSNRNQLLLQGSIDKIWEMIPRTIQDAITLVRKLELRYLWVDALCLLQNDWQDLDRGVNVMDQVYERSWFTIIAACGHDADAGLPGVQEGSRKMSKLTLEVNEEISLGVYTSIDQLVKGTVYNSRAWTFQEHVLCRRALYFVDNKVFFRCSKVEYSESCRDQSRPLRPLTSDSSLLPQAVYMESPLEDYSILLLYYSMRALTNQGDALRAMAGIIRRLSEKVKYRFFEGLPTAVLDAFLIFKAHGTNLQRRSGFPSYSWTGWRGRINIDTPSPSAMNEWLASRTWIIWYKRSPSGIANLVWDPSANESFPIRDKTYHGYRERRHFEPLFPLSFATLRTAPTENLSSSIPASPYPLLQFWTLTVFYRIAEINVFKATCRLVGEDGIDCGNMSLDGSEETTLFDSVEPLEIILLSEAEGRREYYNVMLLEWNEGVAERRGIGTILQSAINNSFSPGPLWKEILLG